MGFICQPGLQSIFVFSTIMFSAKHNLTHLPAQALDAYLEKGWFRMNQTLFITHFLHFERQFYPAVWLRYPLKNGLATFIDKKLKPIRRRFRLEVMPWQYSPEQEALFSVYRAKAGIDLTPTLLELLMGYEEVNVFNTLQVEVYDETRLIALGIFDLGEKSAAGITNIFHPDYRKYSLGKALIYAKMQYSQQMDCHWFYPGYAVPGKSRFNYKLDIAPEHTEYFYPVNQQWLPYYPTFSLPNLLDEMESGLGLLQEKLSVLNKKCTIVYYQHFDADLLGLHFTGLLPYPLFLLVGYNPGKANWLVAVNDLVSGKYRLLFCNTLISPVNNHRYEKPVCTDILQVLEYLTPALDLPGMVEYIKNFESA
jgi:arginine-tRNA-protein transferase